MQHTSDPVEGFPRCERAGSRILQAGHDSLAGGIDNLRSCGSKYCSASRRNADGPVTAQDGGIGARDLGGDAVKEGVADAQVGRSHF